MNDIGEFFLSVVVSTASTSLLLALTLWLFKARISHWLNKDIENIKAQHQRDLEAAKAGYARELESYRTSLISQIEAKKAEYEVKKQFALKVHEIRFKNLEILHSICTVIPAELMIFVTTPTNKRTDNSELKILEMLDDFSNSMMRLTLFLEQQEMDLISELNKYLRQEVIKEYPYGSSAIQKMVSELNKHISPVHDILTNYLKPMMKLD